MPLRRKTVEKEAVFVVLGINFEGIPEVLTFDIRPSETKEAREEVFKDVKKRGVTSARILASDGFAGINELVKDIFPGCLYQRCFIHLCRNLMKKVRQKDKKKIAQDFMELAQKENGEQAIESFDEFVKKWSDDYKIIKSWADNIDKKHIFNFYHFPKELRSTIYSNNRIESFNEEIRRNAKAHVQFCTEDAEEKFLVTLFNQFNFKRKNGI